MAGVYNTISIVSFVLCGVFALISVFIWFRFHVWDIINDLSGKTAKKSIAQMRYNEEKQKNDKKKDTSRKTGKKVSIISENNNKNSNFNTQPDNGTSLSNNKELDDYDISQTTKLDRTGSGQTARLGVNNAPNIAAHTNKMLSSNMHKGIGSEDTTLLSFGDGNTELISEGTVLLEDKEIEKALSSQKIKIQELTSIVLIHTDEVI